MAEGRRRAGSSNPRVRRRSKKAFVADGAVLAQMHDLVEFEFKEQDHHQLLIPLAVSPVREVIGLAQLQHLASQYLHWRKTPLSSREIVKRDLFAIADYCDQKDAKEPLSGRDLVNRISSLDSDAQLRLCLSLSQRADWPESYTAVEWLFSDPDPDLVREAAFDASKYIKAGAYADYDLHHTIMGLIEAYENVTGRMAVIGRKESQARICELAYAFFRCVDADISEGSVWNALDQFLRWRRGRRHQTTPN